MGEASASCDGCVDLPVSLVQEQSKPIRRQDADNIGWVGAARAIRGRSQKTTPASSAGYLSSRSDRVRGPREPSHSLSRPCSWGVAVVTCDRSVDNLLVTIL